VIIYARSDQIKITNHPDRWIEAKRSVIAARRVSSNRPLVFGQVSGARLPH
jgi:hypothetical protein